MITCTLSFARHEREIMFRNGNEHLTSQDEKTIFVLLGVEPTGGSTRVPRMSFGATHSCVAPVP